jgi:hypothetical protein
MRALAGDNVNVAANVADGPCAVAPASFTHGALWYVCYAAETYGCHNENVTCVECSECWAWRFFSLVAWVSRGHW